jgi:hypothetical protein
MVLAAEMISSHKFANNVQSKLSEKMPRSGMAASRNVLRDT